MIKRIPEDTSIRYDSTTITPSKYVKNLGIYIDCHMTFDPHINEMYKKVMGTLLFLIRINTKFENNTRTMVVESLALSVMNYCLRFYGSTNNTLLHRVQKLQNFAANICVGGARKSEHVTPFITQFQWLKVKDKFLLDAAFSVYKIANKMFPEWYLKLSTISEALHNAHT